MVRHHLFDFIVSQIIFYQSGFQLVLFHAKDVAMLLYRGVSKGVKRNIVNTHSSTPDVYLLVVRKCDHSVVTTGNIDNVDILPKLQRFVWPHLVNWIAPVNSELAELVRAPGVDFAVG